MVRRLCSWGVAIILIFGPFVECFAAQANGGKEWGEVFREEHEKQKYTELTSLLKAKLIAEYLVTLQK